MNLMTTTNFTVFLYELITQKKYKESVYKRLQRQFKHRFYRKPKKRVIHQMTDEGAQRLAAAIIEAAVEEYREAGIKLKTLEYKYKRKLVKDPESEMNHLKVVMNMNRKFIKTSPIVILMNVDPDWCIETLDSQIEKYDPGEHIKQKRGLNRVR